VWKVEFRNDRGDWIKVDGGLRGFFPSLASATRAAEKMSEKGYTARITKDGQILFYIERAAK